MRPVEQTRFGVPDGNCFTACIASLLELAIEDVPDYQCDYGDGSWWDKWVAWFAERGLRPALTWNPPPGLAVMAVSVPSPHAVVVRDGSMIWNPMRGAELPPHTRVDWYLALVPA